MSATQYYAFTLKCLKKGTTSGPLLGTMHKMIAKYKAIYVEHVFETDSKERLHIHGTFLARKSLYSRLFSEKFYHIHIDPLKTTEDLVRWTKYIHDDDDGYKKWYSELLKGAYKFSDPSLTLDVLLEDNGSERSDNLFKTVKITSDNELAYTD